MGKESYKFADLTNVQLDELCNMENKINDKGNKDVIVLAFTKK